MTTRSWMLINAVLLCLAGLSVTLLMEVPAEVVKQRKLTQKAIDYIPPHSSASGKNLKGASPSHRHHASRQDTWPSIRRGSLKNIWEMTLFSPQRSELKEKLLDGKEDQQQEEELPAPPTFELIGILTANASKVAIIELQSRPGRQVSRYDRRRTYSRPQTNQPQKPTASYEPSFVTAHEQDSLGDSGFTVKAIQAAERTVILHKNGLDYKLTLNKDSAQAVKRKDSQITFAKSVQERQQARDAQQATRRQQQQADKASKLPEKTTGNAVPATGAAPGRRYVPAATHRTRGNVPVNASQPDKPAWGSANQRRLMPARQR